MTGKIVAPVVVNPETDSNNAPTTCGATPVRMKGRLPTVTSANHPRPTTTRLPRRLMLTPRGVRNHSTRPATAVTPAEISHPPRSPSPTERMIDGTMASEVPSNSTPITLKTARMFIASRLAGSARGVK